MAISVAGDRVWRGGGRLVKGQPVSSCETFIHVAAVKDPMGRQPETVREGWLPGLLALLPAPPSSGPAPTATAPHFTPSEART